LKVTPHHTALAPTVDNDASGTRYTWDVKDVPPSGLDDDRVPGWYDAEAWVQATDFASWREVGEWALAMFPTAPPLAPSLQALLGQWSGASEERALKAVRFVQDQVRYLGIEIGPNSHQPHPAATVLAQRFGDCKDKALLLTSLLRALGIEAYPALVNTDVRRGLDDWAPTPFAFDHVIVLVRLGTRTLWVDATASELGGALIDTTPPPFERALVLEPGVSGLTTIDNPSLPRPAVEVVESYKVKSYGSSVHLEVKTTLRGHKADEMRSDIATRPVADFAKSYINHYAHDDPDIKAAAPPRFEDDREKNVLVVSEAYELPKFWSGTSRDFHAWAIAEKLSKPKITLRTAPLAVSHPVYVAQVQEFDLPDALDVRPEHADIADSAFRFKSSFEAQGKRITLACSLQSLGDSVPTDKLAAHIAAIDRVRDELSYGIDYTSKARPHAAAAGGSDVGDSVVWIMLGGLGVVLCVGAGRAVFSLRQRARRAAFLRQTHFQPGDAPQSAIFVARPEDLEARLRELSCRCGASLAEVADERHGISYQHRALTLVNRHCPACLAEQSVYFEVAASV
jgi:hypothetical protein